MEAVRMVLVTLALTVAAVLILALVAHVAAWMRRHPGGQLHLVGTRVGGHAARGRQSRRGS